MNRHEMNLHSHLPEQMKARTEVDMSIETRLRLVHNHLHILYGDACNWEETLNRIINNSGRKYDGYPTKFQGYPVYLGQEVASMLSQDEKDKKASAAIQDLYYNIGAYSENEQIGFLGALLGIIPLTEPGHSLNEFIIDKSKIDINDVKDFSHLKMINNLLAPLYLDGFQVIYPGNETVCMQPRRRFYWRGEHAFFPKSGASGYRHSVSNSNVQVLINKCRLCEFRTLISQFDAVKQWDVSYVNYQALAQHYGVFTSMMDLTGDLKTALFFCGTKYDYSVKKWVPLEKKDFEYADSRKSIFEQGGDSRYAVLFRSNVDINDIRWYLHRQSKERIGLIKPIGYQPFMRCSSQHGYMVEVENDYDMKKDPLFDVICIELDEVFTHWIWEEMGQGQLVYPNLDIPDISMYVDKINHTKTFFTNSLLSEFSEEEIDSDRDILKGYGYQIVDGNNDLIPQNEIDRINSSYTFQRATQLARIPQIKKDCIIHMF